MKRSIFLILGWICLAANAAPADPSTEESTQLPLQETSLPALEHHNRSTGARHLSISSAIVDPEDLTYFMNISPGKIEDENVKNGSEEVKDVHAKEIGQELLKEEAPKGKDDMETAAAIVFRPLFAYRQQQAEKRKYKVPRPVYGAPVPVYDTNYNYNYGGGSYYPQQPQPRPQQPTNQGYYIYVPQTGKYVHVPYGYPPVPAGYPQIPYQSPYLSSPSNYL